MNNAKLLPVLAIAALLLAGCASTGVPSQNQSGPDISAPPQNQAADDSGIPAGQGNATNMTCDAYCRSLPHIQCVGTWNISGTYPGCVCGFECDVSGDDGADAPEEPLAVPTDLSVQELLQGDLEKQKGEFYLSNTGVYTEKTYTWLREGTGGYLGESAPPTDVTFDGSHISSILASGFTVFENDAGGADQAYGVAIFNDTRTQLDGYTGSDTFDVGHFPQIIDKELRDCQVYTKDFNVDSDGGWLLAYYFKCARAVDK